MLITISLASNVTNELVASGNEFELGMNIPTIESQANNIPMTKGTMYVVVHLTDKDLRRICRSQYEHLGSAIGY